MRNYQGFMKLNHCFGKIYYMRLILMGLQVWKGTQAALFQKTGVPISTGDMFCKAISDNTPLVQKQGIFDPHWFLMK